MGGEKDQCRKATSQSHNYRRMKNKYSVGTFRKLPGKFTLRVEPVFENSGKAKNK